MEKIKIINTKDFREDLYLYVDDRRKLPFKNNRFDLKEYLKNIYFWNKEKLDKKLNLDEEIQLLVVKKENSFLEENIFFSFLVKKEGLRYIV